MKRTALKFAFCAIALASLCSCTDELEADISALRNKVTDIEETVKTLSGNINSLQTLVSALENNVLIESVTQNQRGDYIIEFSNNSSISIKNGTDGVTPVVGVKFDEDLKGYYWTVNGNWMKDSNGKRVRATGSVPRLKIEDGFWYYSFDDKLTWNPLRIESSGEDGRTVFSSINCSDDYYVTFTLTNGVVFQLPTTKGFTEIEQDCQMLNDKLDAYMEVINSIDSAIFVKSIAEVSEGGKIKGYDITLESGRVLEIRSGANDSTEVKLKIVYDMTSGKHLWTIWDGTEYVVLFHNGERVCADPVSGQPVIGVRDSSGVLYFTVEYENTDPEFITDSTGMAIRASGALGFHFFDKVEASGSVITLTLADGKTVSFTQARPYMPSLEVSNNATSLDASGNAYEAVVTVRDTVYMATPYASGAAYTEAGRSELSAIAVDAGFVTAIDVDESGFEAVNDGARWCYTVKYKIKFNTGTAPLPVGHKFRIAVFLTVDNRVTMKVIEAIFEE